MDLLVSAQTCVSVERQRKECETMSFKVFLLLLLIIICGTFIYMKSQSLGSDDSYFNQNTRYTLGKYSLARWILSLHKDGDARAMYLLGSSPITLEVVRSVNAPLDEKPVKDFANRIEEYTGRKVVIFNTDTISETVVRKDQLKGIAATRRRHMVAGQPNLFVVYAEDFLSDKNEIGMTIEEYGILLSHRKIVDLTSSHPQAKNQYITSTLLHEFGHQIGLPHNTNNSCIMNESVDGPADKAFFSGFFTVTKFCSEELETLKQIKARLQ